MTVVLRKTRNSINGPKRINLTSVMNATCTAFEIRGPAKAGTLTSVQMWLVDNQHQVMVTRNSLRSRESI